MTSLLQGLAKELGLSTSGLVTEEALRTLIVGAYKNLSSKGDPRQLLAKEDSADVTIKLKLKQRQQQEEDGQLMEVEAGNELKEQEESDAPAAKRAKVEAEDQGEAAAPAPAPDTTAPDADGDGVVATLQVHGALLSARSKCFEAQLMGAASVMLEGQQRCITVELDDHTAVRDFHRLIRLTYTPSYTVEDGRRLEKDELVRLLVMANGFELLACVTECALALRPFAGADDAVLYFHLVPETLLTDAALIDTTLAAGDVLAEWAGPVERLWRPAKATTGSHRTTWCLDPRIEALPLAAMEALLLSDKLELASENYAFSLALWYCMEQEKGGDEEDQRQCFDRLLKTLRWARMSPDFVASVAQHDWVRTSKLLPSILTRALWRRGSRGRRYHEPKLPPSRVPAESKRKYSVTLTACFTKAVVETIKEPEDEVSVPLGLFHGYPCRLSLIRRKEGSSLGLYVGSPFVTSTKDMTLDTPLAQPQGHLIDDDDWRGFEYRVKRGTIGGATIAEEEEGDEEEEEDAPHDGTRTDVDGSDPICVCDLADCVYDKNNELQVELELEMRQPEDC